MKPEKYSKEWVDAKLSSGKFDLVDSNPRSEKIRIAHKYPMLLDPKYEWGLCPKCSKILHSSDIRSYENILCFMSHYEKRGIGFKEAYITCDKCHGRHFRLEQIQEYLGPKYDNMPEHQLECYEKRNVSCYFVV